MSIVFAALYYIGVSTFIYWILHIICHYHAIVSCRYHNIIIYTEHGTDMYRLPFGIKQYGHTFAKTTSFQLKVHFSTKKFIKHLAKQKEYSTFAPRLRENAAANEIAKEVWVSG